MILFASCSTTSDLRHYFRLYRYAGALLIACLLAVSTAALAQSSPQGEVKQQQGGMSTGMAHAAVKDALSRPITAGGFVDGAPVVFTDITHAAGLDKFVLMGHSQGGAVAIAYAVRHPERVSHLVLCGAYSRGARHRDHADAVEVRRALETLVQVNWGKTNPAFFHVVTDLYIPENASAEVKGWFKDLQIISVSTENLVKFMRACDEINVRPLLPQLSVPTIVFHSDRDRIAPRQEGLILAAEIPGARFVPLSSANHLLLADEPAWKVFREELASFLGK